MTSTPSSESLTASRPNVTGGYWTTKRGRRAAMYRARSTERGLSLYTVTVDVNRVYAIKAGRYAEDNKQNRIVRTGKSEAEVTSNKKNCA